MECIHIEPLPQYVRSTISGVFEGDVWGGGEGQEIRTPCNVRRLSAESAAALGMRRQTGKQADRQAARY